MYSQPACGAAARPAPRMADARSKGCRALQHDIDNWSLWLDVKIALKTIPAVLSPLTTRVSTAAAPPPIVYVPIEARWPARHRAQMRMARPFMPGAWASRRSLVTSDASRTSASAT